MAQILLTVFVALNASFFMGFFFLLAGYFTPSAVDRKGPARFLWDRILRLGLPLGAFVLVIEPLIDALLTVAVWQPGSSFSSAFLAQYRPIGYEPGPLWFVAALLILSAAYAVARAIAAYISRRPRVAPERRARPTDRSIVLFAVAVGLATFAVRVVFPSGRA